MSITELSVLTESTIGGLRVQDIESRPVTYNMLVYGEPGVGKTVFAGSASALKEFSPVLFLDVEGGTLSLHNTYPDCRVVRVKSWRDIQKLYEDLYDGKTPFKTIVIDSLSEIGTFCMTEIMREVCAKDPERDREVPSVREWGILLERMRMLIRAFRDLETVHVIATSHIRTEKSQTGASKNFPALNGQLMRQAAGFFDFVFYLYMPPSSKNVQERLLLTAPNDKYIAKDRSGRLPVLVENPTMQVVMELILGGTQNTNENTNENKEK